MIELIALIVGLICAVGGLFLLKIGVDTSSGTMAVIGIIVLFVGHRVMVNHNK